MSALASVSMQRTPGKTRNCASVSDHHSSSKKRTAPKDTSSRHKRLKPSRVALPTNDAEAYGVNVLDRAALYAPAYGLTSGKGPQCSGSDDFCFFCTFECEPSSVGSEFDLFGAMKDMVNAMVQQKRDFNYIVNAICTAYTDTVKGAVTYTAEDGSLVTAPVWKRRSVARHLLYSLEHECIFDSAITNMYKAVISNINNSMMDRETGDVVEERRVAFIDTVSAYGKWQKSARILSSGIR